jgi:hypothetical protein
VDAAALSVALLVGTGLGFPASADDATGLPVKELARETYDVVTDPAALPEGVRAAWALQLGQNELDVAAAGARYNSTDLGSGTRHRLILAAVGPKHAVVYFQSGGIAVYRRVFVFSRGEESATFLWSGRPKDRYKDAQSFLGAIKNGKLWRQEER